jgi:phage terminase large subunit-like protein
MRAQGWTLSKGKPINIDEVDDYMLWLNTRYHLGLVTYDQWNSQSSINKLRKCGIPAQETRFSKPYKIQIYDELHKLVAHEKLKIPHHKILKDEMLNLQRKFMPSGYRIYPKAEGEVRTDDCVDALAGACFNALKVEATRLPQSKLVNMRLTPSTGNNVWRRSMPLESCSQELLMDMAQGSKFPRT